MQQSPQTKRQVKGRRRWQAKKKVKGQWDRYPQLRLEEVRQRGPGRSKPRTFKQYVLDRAHFTNAVGARSADGGVVDMQTMRHQRYSHTKTRSDGEEWLAINCEVKRQVRGRLDGLGLGPHSTR